MDSNSGSVSPVKKVKKKTTSLRQGVIREILPDEPDRLPTPEEAIGELDKATRNWGRVTRLYQLLVRLQEEIPKGASLFPLLEVKASDSDDALCIDPATWTEKDQMKLIQLIMGNIASDYHKQLRGLADAAVTGVAAFVAVESGADDE